LLSTPTATQFNLPTSAVTYQDVGVAGTDNFNVSTDLYIAIANHYYNQTNVDVFDANNHPVLNGYQLIQSGNSVRIQTGPQAHTPQYPNTQAPSIGDLGDLFNGFGGGHSSFDDIEQLTSELNAVDVVGMPAMKGKVVVIDPTRTAAVDDFLNNI